MSVTLNILDTWQDNGKTHVIMSDVDARLFVQFRQYQNIWESVFAKPLINTKVTLNFNGEGILKSATIPITIKT